MQITYIILAAISSFFLLFLLEMILEQNHLLRYGIYRKPTVSPTLLGTTDLFSRCK